MRKCFNNVLGHICTQPQALNGTSSQNETFFGPHFGVQNLDPKTGAWSQSFLKRGTILGSKFWTPKWGPPGVVFFAPARFPKTFLASKSLGLRWHGWLRVSPFCWAVTLIAAASFAFLRTGEAPCSATGFCADFLTPFRGPRKYQFLL